MSSKWHPRLVLAVVVAAAIWATAPTDIWADSDSHEQHYKLRTDMTGDGMAFYGVSPEIKDMRNPVLRAEVGDTIEITLTDGDGAEHDIVLPDLKVWSDLVSGRGKSITLAFTANTPGTFSYFCDLPGHRQAGMEGTLRVAESETTKQNMSDTASGTAGMSVSATSPSIVDIVRAPTDLPGPLPRRGPTQVRIDLRAREVTGTLAAGTTFTYWTFDGQVPGPFFRVRLGDTVEVHFANDPSSHMAHSVDFHAVTGPGGGAVMTVTPPGAETTFSFKALHVGLFVYHCATPMVAEHIANGMYGMILVEPPEGLRAVDREFYVMQGEIYTKGGFGEKGLQAPDTAKLLDERPDYFVFNGAVGGLTEQKPLRATVGQTVRLFFGDGGPNAISSLHLIGEVLDRVYNLGSLTSAPLTDVQTVMVPPGGSTLAELTLEVPGRFILVDHSLSRMQRGLMGWLVVDGKPRPDLYNGVLTPGGGH